MTVLITGGAGFIGSRRVEKILTRGQRVRVLAAQVDTRQFLGAAT